MYPSPPQDGGLEFRPRHGRIESSLSALMSSANGRCGSLPAEIRMAGLPAQIGPRSRRKPVYGFTRIKLGDTISMPGSFNPVSSPDFVAHII